MSAVLALRTATEADVDAVMDLVRACIARMREQGIEQWDEVYPDRATIAADVSVGALYIASFGDASWAGVFTLDDREDPRWAVARWTITGTRIGVVHRLMVDPRQQGRGLARQLMQLAEARARSLGYGAIRLDCYSQNPQALRLYQGLGYLDAGGAQLRKGLFRCLEKSLEPSS
jgi:ribosomal protein S18 acetylase RimI-like enzyme